MTDKTRSPRMQLLRDSAVLQIKLLVDGLRDAVLIPVSIVATILGLLRSDTDPDREFRRVLKLGRRSERWINLFGHQSPVSRSHPSGSLDQLLERVEETVLEQYRKGKSAEEARAAINAALDNPEEKPAEAAPDDQPADQTGTQADTQADQTGTQANTRAGDPAA